MERLRSHDTYHLPCYVCIENGHVGLIQFRGKRPSPSDYWVSLWSQHPDSNVQSIRSHDGKHERSWLYSDCIVSYRQRCCGYISQFIAAILVFSIAITKVYMAEKSYLEKGNRNKNT